MEKKTKEQLISDYKKSNTLRRQKLAAKNGFITPEAYLASLQSKKTVKTLNLKVTSM